MKFEILTSQNELRIYRLKKLSQYFFEQDEKFDDSIFDLFQRTQCTEFQSFLIDALEFYPDSKKSFLGKEWNQHECKMSHSYTECQIPNTAPISTNVLKSLRMITRPYSIYVNNKFNKDGDTPLLAAMKSRNTAKVQELAFSSGIDLNTKSKFGLSPLFHCLINKDYETLKLLLARGANPNIEGVFPTQFIRWNHSTSSALHLAVEMNDEGANPDAISATGSTPFIIAVFNGNQDLIKIYSDLRPALNFNAKARGGKNALFIAIDEKHVDIFKDIAERLHIDLNAISESGNSVFLWALEKNNLSIARYLATKTIDFQVINKENESALHIASKKQNVDLLELVLKQKIDLELKDKRGNTALMNALTSKFNPCVELLISKGANLNVKNNLEETALHFATQFNSDPKVLKQFIQAYPDVNIQDHKGKTPLMWAIQYSNLEAVKILLSHGADFRHIDKGGEQCLTLASKKNHPEILKIFIEKMYTNLDHPFQGGKTALLLAAENGLTQNIKLLLSHHASPNLLDEHRNNALMLAAANSQTNSDTIETLLKAQLKLDTQNKKNETAIHLALQANNIKLSEFMINIGGNIDLKNDTGKSAREIISENYRKANWVNLLSLISPPKKTK